MRTLLLTMVWLLAVGNTGFSAVTYESVSVPGVVITGVRSTSSSTDDVVITSSYTTGGVTNGAIYSGSLAAAPSASVASWVPLTPVFSGQTVTSSTLYGPNTSLFTPSIGAGNVTAVGSYKYAEGSSGPGFDHGLLYKGSVLGGGTWTQIDATPLLTGGENLLNTIGHSNMGDLVVGNYDTDITTGKAFIYNMNADTWFDLNPTGSKSVTAYGIWQNSSTSYTIAGGLSDVTSFGLDEGYLVNYDSSTGALEHFKTFNYNNEPISSLVSHIDGITATPDGFNITGDYAEVGGGMGAFFGSIKVLPNGSFGEAAWTDIAFPGATITSGNTVVGNTVFGVYGGAPGGPSYIATVPEPTSGSLCLLGAGLLLLRFHRGRRQAG
jgi:hypothetical protein